MPKLITIHHPDQVAQQARDYVQAYILLPSGVVGLFCLVGAIGGLAYQLIASDTYSWTTFFFSTGLFVLGVALGMGQTSYHRYLFTHFPEAFAARMRLVTSRQKKKVKKETPQESIDHPGRKLAPVAYIAGIALLIGSSVVAIVHGQVEAIPAFLMPWAGFYWVKLFLWRRIILKK
ncbi:MAG: hypothetical protein NNA21_09140 [Nitrospira sp.]|nr:hypothetical protein [Nitrospira sp.]MCP9462659.1 hypothetical protein [Nitrospira sp.]MCP9475755.1 hypothetical protein [Nitrospira sp.]